MRRMLLLLTLASAMVLPGCDMRREQVLSQSRRTFAELTHIAIALEEHRLSSGRYPTGEWSSVTHDLFLERALSAPIPTDVWKTPLQYEAPGAMSASTFYVLKSCGRDRTCNPVLADEGIGGSDDFVIVGGRWNSGLEGRRALVVDVAVKSLDCSSGPSESLQCTVKVECKGSSNIRGGAFRSRLRARRSQAASGGDSGSWSTLPLVCGEAGKESNATATVPRVGAFPATVIASVYAGGPGVIELNLTNNVAIDQVEHSSYRKPTLPQLAADSVDGGGGSRNE